MLLLVYIICTVSNIVAETNNVCTSFPDYYNNIENNKNCYYNPDIDLEVPDLIARYGFPVERYEAVTEDGYILTLFRIPYGRSSPERSKRTPILLQHGMCLNSASFVDIGNTSLAFQLVEAGYDVWLGNFRGTQYSKGHVHLSVDSVSYWNFSFHEMGIYDLPALLEVISNVTQQKGNITYLGFSMGTTAGFVYNTIFPEHASQTIKLFINLAPVAYVANVRTIFRYFAFVWDFLQGFVDDDTFQKDIMRRDSDVVELLKVLCLPYPYQMRMCWLSTMLLSGFDIEQMNPETLPVTTIQHTDSTAMKVLSHYIQGINYHTFSQYDYGIENNLRVYGTPTPPQYNLSAIQVPVYIVYGNNDWIASEEDVLRLYNELPTNVKQYGIHKVNWTSFTHTDFLTAKDVKTLVYDELLEFLKNL